MAPFRAPMIESLTIFENHAYTSKYTNNLVFAQKCVNFYHQVDSICNNYWVNQKFQYRLIFLHKNVSISSTKVDSTFNSYWVNQESQYRLISMPNNVSTSSTKVDSTSNCYVQYKIFVLKQTLKKIHSFAPSFNLKRATR